MLSNAYFLAKFRFDTAENEPAKNLQKKQQNLPILLTLTPEPGRQQLAARSVQRRRGRAPVGCWQSSGIYVSCRVRNERGASFWPTLKGPFSAVLKLILAAKDSCLRMFEI